MRRTVCALLNSWLAHDLVSSHSVAGGKGFGTPSILDYLPLRKFDPSDPRHIALFRLSRRLHSLLKGKRVSEGEEVAEIDRLAELAFANRGDLSAG